MAKKIAIGAIFRHERETRGISQDAVAKELRVSKAHIAALEDGKYSFFPARVYARGLVKKYAIFLNFDENESVREFEAAWNEAMPERRHEPLSSMAEKRRIEDIATPQNIFWSLGLLFLLLITLYGGNSAFSTTRKPHFTFDEPEDAAMAESPIIAVRGTADARIELTLNEQPIYIGSDGTFSMAFVLPKGINLLRLEGKNSFGRTRVIEKRVVVR